MLNKLKRKYLLTVRTDEIVYTLAYPKFTASSYYGTFKLGATIQEEDYKEPNVLDNLYEVEETDKEISLIKTPVMLQINSQEDYSITYGEKLYKVWDKKKQKIIKDNWDFYNEYKVKKIRNDGNQETNILEFVILVSKSIFEHNGYFDIDGIEALIDKIMYQTNMSFSKENFYSMVSTIHYVLLNAKKDVLKKYLEESANNIDDFKIPNDPSYSKEEYLEYVKGTVAIKNDFNNTLKQIQDINYDFALSLLELDFEEETLDIIYRLLKLKLVKPDNKEDVLALENLSKLDKDLIELVIEDFLVGKTNDHNVKLVEVVNTYALKEILDKEGIKNNIEPTRVQKEGTLYLGLLTSNTDFIYRTLTNDPMKMYEQTYENLEYMARQIRNDFDENKAMYNRFKKQVEDISIYTNLIMASNLLNLDHNLYSFTDMFEAISDFDFKFQKIDRNTVILAIDKDTRTYFKTSVLSDDITIFNNSRSVGVTNELLEIL